MQTMAHVNQLLSLCLNSCSTMGLPSWLAIPYLIKPLGIQSMCHVFLFWWVPASFLAVGSLMGLKRRYWLMERRLEPKTYVENDTVHRD